MTPATPPVTNPAAPAKRVRTENSKGEVVVRSLDGNHGYRSHDTRTGKEPVNILFCGLRFGEGRRHEFTYQKEHRP